MVNRVIIGFIANNCERLGGGVGVARMGKGNVPSRVGKGGNQVKWNYAMAMKKGVPSPVMTMRMIAELAGVSRTAVSAVVNNQRGTIRMNEATRRKIEAVLRQTNYQANMIGKALALGRSLVIGVIVQELDLVFIAQALQAIEDVAEQRHYGILLMTSRRVPERQERIMEFMLKRRVDGIVYGDRSEMSKKTHGQLIQKGVPVVYLFQYPPKNRLPRSGFVCVDADQVGYQAVRHLLDLGHRHIACVGVDTAIMPGIRRAAAAVPGRKKIEQWPWLPPASRGQATLDRWLGATPRPTALFFQGDEYACQVLHLAIRHGIKIPEDLALIGTDDMPVASQAAVPLTTINQPKYEQGLAAAEVLFEMIDGQPGREVIFQPNLIWRQTT